MKTLLRIIAIGFLLYSPNAYASSCEEAVSVLNKSLSHATEATEADFARYKSDCRKGVAAACEEICFGKERLTNNAEVLKNYQIALQICSSEGNSITKHIRKNLRKTKRVIHGTNKSCATRPWEN